MSRCLLVIGALGVGRMKQQLSGSRQGVSSAGRRVAVVARGVEQTGLEGGLRRAYQCRHYSEA